MMFTIDGDRDGLVAWPDDTAGDGWASFLDACEGAGTLTGELMRVPGWAIPAITWWFDTSDAELAAPTITGGARRRLRAAANRAERLEALIATTQDTATWPVTVDGPDGPILFSHPSGFGIVRELRDFQTSQVARLLAGDGGANFSVPGSGKTTVALACWGAWNAAGAVARTVVVAPFSAWEAWQTEPTDCFAGDSAPRVALGRGETGQIVVLNYEALQDSLELDRLLTWVSAASSLVIFDEAHRAKAGRDGLRGRACLDLAGAATRRLVLTGTPMPNTHADLAAMFDLAWPGRGRAMIDHPHRSRLFVRATKSDIGLPPARRSVERIPLSAAHRRLYEAAVDAATTLTHGHEVADDLERIGRIVMLLLQLPTNPAAILDQNSPLRMVGEAAQARLEELAHNAAAGVVPAKFVRVRQLVEANAAAGAKTLLWSNFTHHVAELARLLGDHQPAVITGALPRYDPTAAVDRARELTRFRTDAGCRVLVATPQTLGEGVSLHRVCQSQVWVDRTFNAGVYLQALDRTHRLGMPEGTHSSVTALVAADTIDEVVEQRVGAKLDRMGDLLDDPDLRALSLPDADDDFSIVDLFLDGGNRDDLQALFAHLHT